MLGNLQKRDSSATPQFNTRRAQSRQPDFCYAFAPVVAHPLGKPADPPERRAPDPHVNQFKVLRRSLSQRKGGGEDENGKLYISVSADDITDIRVWMLDAKTGEQKELQPYTDYTLEFVRHKMERCQVCERTYPRCQMVVREDKQLCLSCDQAIVQPEDIPF